MKPLTVVGVLAFALLAGHAAISAQDPAFEVVSVKPDANPAVALRPASGPMDVFVVDGAGRPTPD